MIILRIAKNGCTHSLFWCWWQQNKILLSWFTLSWLFNICRFTQRIQQGFERSLWEKLVQISMDGPNVNLKLLEKSNEERTWNEFHRLISIGSCGLHTIHVSFRAGAEATASSTKNVLTGAYYVLRDSPRREDCQEVTGSNKFPLNFCSTR